MKNMHDIAWGIAYQFSTDRGGTVHPKEMADVAAAIFMGLSEPDSLDGFTGRQHFDLDDTLEHLESLRAELEMFSNEIPTPDPDPTFFGAGFTQLVRSLHGK